MWKSLGHFFASVFQKVLAVNTAVQKDAPVIEGATAAIPVYGPLAVTVEQAAFAVLGEIAAAINAGGAAAEAHLTSAGLDQNVIDTVKAVAASTVSLADVVKAAPATKATAVTAASPVTIIGPITTTTA
jgi:hypothetical protein